MKSPYHSIIPCLPFLLNHLILPSPELDPILDNYCSSQSESESESELLYEWWFTNGDKPLEPLNTCGYSPYVTFSLMGGSVCRLQLLLVLASAVTLRLESVSDWRLPQHGGPGPRIYIPPEQGGPVIPPGTGFPFRRLLRLARLRWRY
jgi:hypothetical protein